MRKVNVLNFDLCVQKQKGEGKERTINALKELYEKYEVLGKHEKHGVIYYIVKGG